jgi:hypothetical protein
LPNGTTGWVRRGTLGGYETVRTHLIIDRARLTARLQRRERTVFLARIGIGKRRWPTPAGSFIVRNRITGFDDPEYGALAFGTTARSDTLTDWPGGGFIGIHGTNQPAILPGRVSHGCIRMRNRDIRRLDRKMPPRHAGHDPLTRRRSHAQQHGRAAPPTRHKPACSRSALDDPGLAGAESETPQGGG